MWSLPFACAPEPDPPATARAAALIEPFDTWNDARWRIAHRAWGGDNGGVHPDNVSVVDGVLRLEAHGDLWEGGPPGIDSDGGALPHGRRVGAAIATEEYYASGAWTARVKAAPAFGVCSAIWTFHYVEAYPGDPAFPTGVDQPYVVWNHEIDIEIPGRPAAPAEDISFRHALTNTWTGVRPGASTIGYTDVGVAQDDGQWHDYRIEWHTGDVDVAPQVVFSVDGVEVSRLTTTVPDRAGRLWLGAWFPQDWAGQPDFDVAVMEVDEVRFTPFHEAGDVSIDESYPDDGWL